ncbi:uncharacterized mitochondrial protein AtMg00860-like [Jatropha curcas]|uniref:uncharacterized mitochondrial protein AtMg00860-like n=1 Tax=Jatropha curcas TaxID=180498 RepID=UPI00189432E6|nr:uncharacterized mitochondrial protein AtMg00860-like [Jatropha curcas]XP_037492867.1 uncharacterized mitochondrial protein AtMg00860-like [Jatropha curcas]
MNAIFKPVLRKFVLVFFDDILVYSQSREEHLQHLAWVFMAMRTHTLLAKKSECSCGAAQVEYLGQVISAHRAHNDSAKISAVKDWPEPQTVKQCRSFLGLTGYYRPFVAGYGTIARPLRDLLKLGNFHWTAKAQTAFHALKQAKIQAPYSCLAKLFQNFYCTNRCQQSWNRCCPYARWTSSSLYQQDTSPKFYL